MNSNYPFLELQTLYSKALTYLLSIQVGNKNKKYIPTGNLVKDSVIKTVTYAIKSGVKVEHHYNEDDGARVMNNTNMDQSANITIKTREEIPLEFLNSITNDNIVNDWNSYKVNYIEPRIGNKKYVGISEVCLFLYLFKYFVDKKFKQFSDSFTKNFVWLYNSNSVAYSPTDLTVVPAEMTDSIASDYITALVQETVRSDFLSILAASAAASSSSSSSCSSSCSSSSCSSSCSSSSSSVFIAYFNINGY